MRSQPFPLKNRISHGNTYIKKLSKITTKTCTVSLLLKNTTYYHKNKCLLWKNEMTIFNKHNAKRYPRTLMIAWHISLYSRIWYLRQLRRLRWPQVWRSGNTISTKWWSSLRNISCLNGRCFSFFLYDRQYVYWDLSMSYTTGLLYETGIAYPLWLPGFIPFLCENPDGSMS